MCKQARMAQLAAGWFPYPAIQVQILPTAIHSTRVLHEFAKKTNWGKVFLWHQTVGYISAWL